MEDTLIMKDFVATYEQEVQNLLPRARIVYVPPNEERPCSTIYTYSPDELDDRCGKLGIETLLPNQTRLSKEIAQKTAKLIVDAFNRRWLDSKLKE